MVECIQATTAPQVNFGMEYSLSQYAAISFHQADTAANVLLFTLYVNSLIDFIILYRTDTRFKLLRNVYLHLIPPHPAELLIC